MPPEKREQRAPLGTRRSTKKSDVAHTSSTLNEAKNTAVTWTIGSKRNGNSRAERFGLSRSIRKIRDTRGQGEPWLPA
jgi:hypothetical protein